MSEENPTPERRIDVSPETAKKLEEKFSRFKEKFEGYRLPSLVTPELLRDPMVKIFQREKLAEKHAKQTDDFVRWAYAKKLRRTAVFNADEFAIETGREKKDADGIVNQAVIKELFVFDRIEDSVHEAENRTAGMVFRLVSKDSNPVRFVEAGLKQGKAIWWRDLTKPLDPIRPALPFLKWIAVWLFGIITALVTQYLIKLLGWT